MTSPTLTVTVPGKTLLKAIGEVPDGVRVLEWDLKTPAPASHIDLLVAPYIAPNVKFPGIDDVTTTLIQSQSIGYDGVEGTLPPGRVYANAATVHETATAELTLALLLAAQRGIPESVRNAQTGLWQGSLTPSVADRNVLIVGYGGVGAAIEARLTGFETHITRVARSARESAYGPVHALADLPGLLPTAEIVILAVPLTADTRDLADAAFLAALPDQALVVNIARGPVLNTAAALAEAESGRLRFALDVTDPEPLPADHPLWTLPNVLITPHLGGAATSMMSRMAALVHRQIRHLLAGEPVENVVLRS
ncbi:phosphoglycerate dehydrogenase-like enzyme [Mycetocola sp. BIGb0189]|uniref:NAD(P)-dependent oxidoreductase n=1 Tax=Mycetocola sp. BIGb0189 TaxID=2940604 RepID=UPI0021699694|nr:NAD(P)-dependent oxidoreductase [Mycetocola sp. BIGb0189]MCS4276575.1 phosphoglycerate dehydrogenase-like enzyme [Mycetocola sp. BIGb0189]